MTLRKIISGGQTGADQGALVAAKELGLETGGWMPLGFRTDVGPRPDFAGRYGMLVAASAGYQLRTRLNVQDSDATLVFGNPVSPGCRLTIGCCIRASRPHLIVYWRPDSLFRANVNNVYADFQSFLTDRRVQTLNVAGNRESRAPGIHDACRDFLLAALTP